MASSKKIGRSARSKSKYPKLNRGAAARLVGTILAPGSFIRLNGSDNNAGWRSQIIGYTVEVAGNSKIVLVYKDEQNYDALTMPELQFTR